MTDVGVSALGAECGQLQSIDLYNCGKVTDAGVSALGAGCGQLQSINLDGCSKVTDVGVSALGDRASAQDLKTICFKISNCNSSELQNLATLLSCRPSPSLSLRII